MEIEYPDRDAALAAYAEAMEIRFEQARDALLKDDQLESALARPRKMLCGRTNHIAPSKTGSVIAVSPATDGAEMRTNPSAVPRISERTTQRA